MFENTDKQSIVFLPTLPYSENQSFSTRPEIHYLDIIFYSAMSQLFREIPSELFLIIIFGQKKIHNAIGENHFQ